MDRRDVEVEAGGRRLPGMLAVPAAAVGVVLFAHGSGSSRLSPRNTAVARHLGEGGLATLLFDLLTDDESEDRANVFDIALLADRLAAATTWLRGLPDVAALPIGYFGASTGAGAALVAAAELGRSVRAVVSRGGRPDLADDALARVTAPTLLIVGGADPPTLTVNEAAQGLLRCRSELRVIPGATHLFEEPGALEEVADLARGWFLEHLPTG